MLIKESIEWGSEPDTTTGRTWWVRTWFGCLRVEHDYETGSWLVCIEGSYDSNAAQLEADKTYAIELCVDDMAN